MSNDEIEKIVGLFRRTGLLDGGDFYRMAAQAQQQARPASERAKALLLECAGFLRVFGGHNTEALEIENKIGDFLAAPSRGEADQSNRVVRLNVAQSLEDMARYGHYADHKDRQNVLFKAVELLRGTSAQEVK